MGRNFKDGEQEAKTHTRLCFINLFNDILINLHGKHFNLAKWHTLYCLLFNYLEYIYPSQSLRKTLTRHFLRIEKKLYFSWGKGRGFEIKIVNQGIQKFDHTSLLTFLLNKYPCSDIFKHFQLWSIHHSNTMKFIYELFLVSFFFSTCTCCLVKHFLILLICSVAVNYTSLRPWLSCSSGWAR